MTRCKNCFYPIGKYATDKSKWGRGEWNPNTKKFGRKRLRWLWRKGEWRHEMIRNGNMCRTPEPLDEALAHTRTQEEGKDYAIVFCLVRKKEFVEYGAKEEICPYCKDRVLS
jgi:hypothetical protein